jgi:serine/threonine protein phosphatase PrpC
MSSDATSGQFCRRCAEPVSHRDRIELDVGVAAGVSDRGRRHHRNEDALALRDVGSSLPTGPGSVRRGIAVAIVCDGVSSSACPDEAAETAAEIAAETLAAALRAEDAPAAATRAAIHAANSAVAELADSHRAAGHGAPACTFVSAIVTDDAVTVGWVGDSRAYWIPQAHTDSTPARLTTDDSWLAQALAAGILSSAQAAADWRAHVITAWLGEGAGPLEPHVVTIEPEGPGAVVVCTDGLWNYLDTVDELATALGGDALTAPLTAAQRLVEIALHRGGHDNVTVAVLPFTGWRHPGRRASGRSGRSGRSSAQPARGPGATGRPDR